MQFVKPFVEGLFQLLLLLPLFLLAEHAFQRNNIKFFITFCLLFLLDNLIVQALSFPLFEEQTWNWGGKTGSLLWALIFIYTNTLIRKKSIGWTFSINHRNGIFLVIAILVLMRLTIRLFFQGLSSYKLETLAYQAVLPGIAEEVVFRGIFLGLLNRIFPRKWSLLTVRFGWALIITSILFGLVHGLSLDKGLMPHFNSQRFAMTLGLGLVLGMIKEKSKSLVPGIILHNAWNIISYWGK